MDLLRICCYPYGTALKRNFDGGSFGAEPTQSKGVLWLPQSTASGLADGANMASLRNMLQVISRIPMRILGGILGQVYVGLSGNHMQSPQ